MAFYGSASSNQSPVLFRGNNRALGINMIIHNDESGSMNDVNNFFNDGNFIEYMQDALLDQKIGDNTTEYPNLYSYFGLRSRNYSSNFSIINSNGTLLIQNTFIRGEFSGTVTKTNWINNYFNNIGNFDVNICNQNNRLSGYGFNFLFLGSDNEYTEDVHGNLWSIFTTPNTITSGTPGRFGSIISSPIRVGSKNIIITASDEQDNCPTQMINVSVDVNSGTRFLNGVGGEISIREYRIISLSSYTSNDYSGVLFYGLSSENPYGYVLFTTPTSYIIVRSTVEPTDWVNVSDQKHDTLTLAKESLGALFKIRDVFTNSGTDNRVAFTKCIAEFLSETL